VQLQKALIIFIGIGKHRPTKPLIAFIHLVSSKLTFHHLDNRTHIMALSVPFHPRLLVVFIVGQTDIESAALDLSF
jgi:hypothetical protein